MGSYPHPMVMPTFAIAITIKLIKNYIVFIGDGCEIFKGLD